MNGILTITLVKAMPNPFSRGESEHIFNIVGNIATTLL